MSPMIEARQDDLEKFIRRENIALYRKLEAETNELLRKMLLKLIANQEQKQKDARRLASPVE